LAIIGGSVPFSGIVSVDDSVPAGVSDSFGGLIPAGFLGILHMKKIGIVSAVIRFDLK